MNNIYDIENIFAKILREEIPCDKFYEDEFCISFKDVAPAAPIHYLVIPKGEFLSFNDFTQKADKNFISGFFKAVQTVASKLNLEEDGYRIIYNHGVNANQTVLHFHVHILGGKPLGGLLSSDILDR